MAADLPAAESLSLREGNAIPPHVKFNHQGETSAPVGTPGHEDSTRGPFPQGYLSQQPRAETAKKTPAQWRERQRNRKQRGSLQFTPATTAQDMVSLNEQPAVMAVRSLKDAKEQGSSHFKTYENKSIVVKKEGRLGRVRNASKPSPPSLSAYVPSPNFHAAQESNMSRKPPSSFQPVLPADNREFIVFHDSDDSALLQSRRDSWSLIMTRARQVPPPVDFRSTLPLSDQAARGIDPQYMACLRMMILPASKLEKAGYIVKLRTKEDMAKDVICVNCGIRVGKFKPSMILPKGELSPGANALVHMMPNVSNNFQPISPDIGKVTAPNGDVIGPVSKRGTPIFFCGFHGGKPVQQHPLPDTLRKPGKVWACCGQPATVKAKPCQARSWHVPRQVKQDELEKDSQYYPTPQPTKSSHRAAAVAIDCEMGTNKNNGSELIRITLVDYFSSTVLLDSLVIPDVPMLHYNTKYSGVRWEDMAEARRTRNCIFGRDAARAAVWRFVGPETIVVAHSGNNDLRALRWIHHNVLDTNLVETVLLAPPKPPKKDKKAGDKERLNEERDDLVRADEEELSGTTEKSPSTAADGSQQPKKFGKGDGPNSLRTLTRVKLGREIQTKGQIGHDSLEDAIAARDLADWHVLHSMGYGELKLNDPNASSLI